MNTNPKMKILPGLTAILGIAALALRALLYRFGQDAQGLLMDDHILNIAVWAVTAFAAVLICLTVSRLDGSARYEHNFGPSADAGMGALVMAVGLCVTLFETRFTLSRLEMVRNLVGLIAVPALIWIAVCRWRGKRPFFLLHAVVCLYLILHSVSHYQAWCSRPQLQDFFFPMMGSILLCLFAYYQTAFDVDLGKRRMQLATGLLAAFACLSALAGGEDPALYLAGAVWSLTNLCSLTPVPRQEEPQQPEEPENEPA